jgi:hypothetical protein
MKRQTNLLSDLISRVTPHTDRQTDLQIIREQTDRQTDLQIIKEQTDRQTDLQII